MTTRVFLLDDHEVVRRGLRELFDAEDDLTVVGEAGTAEEAMARVPATKPDVAVLDVRLPDGDGVEVCRDLRSAMPDLKCLMLTSFADDEALFSAILAGASGYVLKQIKGGDLLSAVRRVAAGESLLDPSLTRQVMERLRGENVEDERVARLTAQERNILELIAEGKTNRQIADELYLAEKTVKNYVSNLLSKMGFARRTEAAVYAAPPLGAQAQAVVDLRPDAHAAERPWAPRRHCDLRPGGRELGSSSHGLEHLVLVVHLGELGVLGDPAEVQEPEQGQHQHDAGQDERDDGGHQGDLAEGPEGVGLEQQAPQGRALEHRLHRLLGRGVRRRSPWAGPWPWPRAGRRSGPRRSPGGARR